MTDAAALIKTGSLAEARAQLVEQVKRNPANPQKRLALAEVLILLGEWEKADTHLDLVSTQDPSWTTMTALLRQLVRAAIHRDDVFDQGRAPDLVNDPNDRIETALRILTEARAGGDAASLRLEADERFSPLALERDGHHQFGWRDADDRTADVLEILTSTGKYVWVALDQVASLTLRPAEQPRDRVWRPAELDVIGGPTGVVYLPMIYPAGSQVLTDAQRLGNETQWVDAAGLSCGLGQRCWLIGDDLVAASEFEEIAVQSPTEP